MRFQAQRTARSFGDSARIARQRNSRKRARGAFPSAILLIAAGAAGCSSGITSVPNSPPGNPSAPPTNVSVAITPMSVSLFLGQTQQFQTSVTSASNEAVTWEVNSQAGGNATVGQISSGGLYTAPGILPQSTTITITAVSVADATVSASATITLQDDIAMTVSPSSADVPQGVQQTFTATIASSGSPAPGVTWSVNGIVGGNAILGTVVANGPDSAVYTAPVVVPSSPTITLAATSIADNSKTASAPVTITCAIVSAISPASASVSLSNTVPLNASFCLANGATVAWDVNGIPGGNGTYGAIAGTNTPSALYSAPPDLPKNNLIAIHAVASAVTSGADSASVSITITSNVAVTISPQSAAVAAFQRTTVTPTVSGTTDAAVSWFVKGIANGNATVGLICLAGSNPCEPPAGPLPQPVDFFAPASVPAANPVTLTAVSAADNSRSGTSTITITGPSGPVGIAVSPAYIFLPPSSSQPDTQQFSANITGTANTLVTWTAQSAITGQGCSGDACGTIDSTGLYTAPTAAPSPNAITITATSQADTTKSSTATVVISSGPVIESILPSSIMAGAVRGFPLVVRGVNFAPGSGSAASVVLLNGSPHPTTCSTAGQCAIALDPSDVSTAATVTIEVQNPGTPGPISNPVPFVIVPFDISAATIPLTSSAPAANDTDIVVTDPTTAAASSAINIQSIGAFAAGASCAVQGSPLTIARPTSGTETVSICVYGNGLDPAFAYAFTGPTVTPNASDIAVTASAITGLFPGMIELDLQITGDTLPGVRSLVVTTLNNDRALATGILEVK